ncbi:MAG TPA: hypothetical protein VFE47_01405 [Tepidisphaeraceae bacterium]|jgi:hypothetical protein|nr:hypothetical protein [Tepidisphaeraceae bacterium]
MVRTKMGREMMRDGARSSRPGTSSTGVLQVPWADAGDGIRHEFLEGQTGVVVEGESGTGAHASRFPSQPIEGSAAIVVRLGVSR